jgi:hypothetical protein
LPQNPLCHIARLIGSTCRHAAGQLMLRFSLFLSLTESAETIRTRSPSSSPSKRNIPTGSARLPPLYLLLSHPSSFISFLHLNYSRPDPLVSLSPLFLSSHRPPPTHPPLSPTPPPASGPPGVGRSHGRAGARGRRPCSPCGGRRRGGPRYSRGSIRGHGGSMEGQRIWSSVVAEVDGGSKAGRRWEQGST